MGIDQRKQVPRASPGAGDGAGEMTVSYHGSDGETSDAGHVTHKKGADRSRRAEISSGAPVLVYQAADRFVSFRRATCGPVATR